MTTTNNKTSNDDIASFLRHKELPQLIAMALSLRRMKEKIRVTKGAIWKSKQRLPASSMSAEEVEQNAVGLGQRLRFVQRSLHASVARGRYPMTDSVMDDMFKILRKELADVTAFLSTSSAAGTVGTTMAPASSDGATAAPVSAAMASRKRMASPKQTHSRVQKDTVAKKSSKGAVSARRTASQTCPSGPPNVKVNSSFPSERAGSIVNKQGPCKWQIDKLMDWMKANNYNPSPDWSEIDELVESTQMKPSEVVAWTAEFGRTVARLRNECECKSKGPDNPKELWILDDDSIPDLDDDKCVENGPIPDKVLVVDLLVANQQEQAIIDAVLDADNGDDKDNDSDWLINFVSELDFECGHNRSEARDKLHLAPQAEQMMTNVALESFTDDELFDDFEFCFQSDVETEHESEAQLQRPFKRHRTDSFDGSIF